MSIPNRPVESDDNPTLPQNSFAGHERIVQSRPSSAGWLKTWLLFCPPEHESNRHMRHPLVSRASPPHGVLTSGNSMKLAWPGRW